MLKEPSTFRVGLAIAAAWAAWLCGGLVYAMSHGSVSAFLVNLPPGLRVVFYFWVLVLSALFGQAVAHLVRGVTGRPPPHP